MVKISSPKMQLDIPEKINLKVGKKEKNRKRKAFKLVRNGVTKNRTVRKLESIRICLILRVNSMHSKNRIPQH